ncbi:MAG: TetR family transcriptional regulator C-terminal domain-containing protein [Pseudomonadota bacterium]
MDSAPPAKPAPSAETKTDARTSARSGAKTGAKTETRIQTRNRAAILEAALTVFSEHGFRGATLDEIATASGLSKPNLLYYFPSKAAIYAALLDGLLDKWLAPLREIDAEGDPLTELRRYLGRKLDMSRAMPRESRLFANEVMGGAGVIGPTLGEDLRRLVDDKAAIIAGWASDGRIAPVDPHHLIFAMWAVTQHYADFDAQVTAVLGPRAETRFADAAATLERLLIDGLAPR